MKKYIAALADMAWTNVLLIGFGLAAAYYFLSYDSGAALSTEIQASTVKLAQSEKQLKDTEKAMEDANRFQAEVQETARQFARINDFMPEAMTEADLQALMTRQAQLAGVRIMKMEPKGGVEHVGFYDKMRLALTAEGTYPQILTFLSYISRVPRLLTFENMSLDYNGINETEESPRLTYQAVVVAYRYVKNAEAPAANGVNNPAIPAIPSGGPK
jgi:Tfp pilus assembly protein PilO